MLLFARVFYRMCELMDPCEAGPSSCAPDTSCEDADNGRADFTKFIAVHGNSFVAGVQCGALFTDGQNQSLAWIINEQLKCAGGGESFKQPDIGATLGWNLFYYAAEVDEPRRVGSPATDATSIRYHAGLCNQVRVSPEAHTASLCVCERTSKLFEIQL